MSAKKRKPQPRGGIGRVDFAMFAINEAQPFMTSAYEPRGPYQECWSNAWDAADADGWHYMEGAARARSPGGSRGSWATHAFCVDSDAVVHDVTEGWGDVVLYLGFRVRRDHPLLLSGGWATDRPLGSVMETMLAAAARSGRPDPWGFLKREFILPWIEP